MEVKITNYNGITLRTKNKYVTDDINVLVDESLIPSGTLDITENGEHDVASYEKVNVNIESSGGDEEEIVAIDSVQYYKENRNKNYPYFPLPSEMQEEQDTIYMLYDASGYMCCPAFQITFTNCVCVVQKYMDTTLVSEYVDSEVVSGTTKYMQFSEEDSDYNTYNYIVIKLQGNITKHYLNYKPKFNNVTYDSYSSGELIEVSGKCAGCENKVVGANGSHFHKKLEYYSFLGTTTTNGHYMFCNCVSLKAIPELDVSKLTQNQGLFENCHSLEAIPNLKFGGTMYFSDLFKNCYKLKTIPLLDTSRISGMDNMFYGCYSLQSIPQLDTHNVSSMQSMFYNCYKLKTIPQLDTSNVKNMSGMFNSCYSLQTIPLLNTSKVTSMSGMFNTCRTLETIPQLDTSNVTTMSSMFNYCETLKTIPLLNTSNVTDMSSMFSSCTTLKTIPQLDTSNVITMNSTFEGCYSLKIIPQLDTSNVTNMWYTFQSCYVLQTIPLLNTSKVTSMGSTFYRCRALQMLPQLDCSNVTTMSNMFSDDYILNKIDIINIKVSFDISKSTMLSQSELVKILNNLSEVTTTQTLTLGSTLRNKLTDDDKLIATNKGWTLA